MGVSQVNGPFVVSGIAASQVPGTQGVLPLSPDAGPSLSFASLALFDPRFSYKYGAGTEANALIAVGIGPMGGFVTVDQIPSTIAVANIAVAAAATSGTPLTLVSTTGAGITVLSSALFIPQTGNTIPTGKLAIDTAPALLLYGTNKSIGVADPTKAIARALSITATSGAVGGAFLISGYDLYGYAQTEKVTVTSSPTGSTTTNGKKAFKFVSSVTPQITDTKSYSVGTSDVYGFPMRVDRFPYAVVGWNGSIISSSTGFVAADTTATATNTTGDVRGTYAVQSASDGTKSLQMLLTNSPANLQTIVGLFGVQPA